MSILINGMEMPKNCDACPMFFEYRFCSLTDDHASSIEWKTEEKRMPNCPLIEIQEHGDLVDQARLLYEMQRIHELCEPYPISRLGIAAAIDVIGNQPVVIPAERSEE